MAGEEAYKQMLAGSGKTLEWVIGEGEDVIGDFMRDEIRTMRKEESGEAGQDRCQKMRDELKGRVAKLSEDEKAKIRT